MPETPALSGPEPEGAGLPVVDLAELLRRLQQDAELLRSAADHLDELAAVLGGGA